jgi:hypothetical protein
MLKLKALQQCLRAIRDVLLDGSKFTYFDIYRKANRLLRIKHVQSSFISAFPRCTLEALWLLLIGQQVPLLSWQRGSF